MVSRWSTLMPYMRRNMLNSLCLRSLHESSVFLLSRPPIGWQRRKTEKAKGPKKLHEKFISSGIEDVSLEDQYTIRIKR